MPRQIEEQEYNFLKSRAQVADFVESIYNDPALTNEAKALIKKKYPQMPIPDFDIRQEVNTALAAERKAREDDKAAEREAASKKTFEETRKRTQQEYGFTDAAMEDLEKFMVERNIGDYEVAATYQATKNPKPSDPTMNDGRWNHDKAPGFAEIAKDPEGWARTEILKSIYNDEERRRQVKF